eukprot:NODE_37_length_2210_cov_241.192041_g20_i0.p1 GENE.NODE_37_length_2210_cov_241.192041_g20_i0~~NODE_37_length_2210_cov_241.192041_g20_i0.p1  ORF type:complete len:154 (+),score=59.21 NODE_37_length_2210_cov_241.192041_g20_i0:1162-1623(+)
MSWSCSFTSYSSPFSPLPGYSSFRVPIGSSGDTFDRFFIRLFEIRESIAVLLFVLSHIPGGVSICSSSSSLITPAICSSDPSSLRDVPLSSLDSLISRFLHLPLPFSSLSPLYSPFHSLSPLFPPRRRSSCVPVEGAHGEFLCFLSACPSRAY